MNRLKPLLITPIIILAGCGTLQKVTPTEYTIENEICIIENKKVRAGFLSAYKEALISKGYDIKILPHDSETTACQTTSTYTASWNWDIIMYMRFAEIKVFTDGKLSGRAMYDAHFAVFNKFINAENKVKELTNQLFPQKKHSINNIAQSFETKNYITKTNEPIKESNPDKYSELIKLNELRKSGIITKEEFESEKAKILSEN